MSHFNHIAVLGDVGFCSGSIKDVTALPGDENHYSHGAGFCGSATGAMDIVEAIVEGRQPRSMTVKRLFEVFLATGLVSAPRSNLRAEF